MSAARLNAWGAYRALADDGGAGAALAQPTTNVGPRS
jgi:hypothetical protein